MDSDLQRQHHQFQNSQQQQQQQHVNSGGLTRYRSAPSSYFANFDDHCEGYLHVRQSSPETEQIVARFMSENSSSPELSPEFVPPMKHEPEVVPTQLMYQSSSRPPLPNQSSTATGSEVDRTNLIRQSSSPAGLFSHPNVDNGYGVMRGMENFGSVDGTNREPSLSSASRLKGQINFSSGPAASSGQLSHMSNIGNKGLGESNSPPDDGSNNESYLTGFPVGSWEDSLVLSENFNGLKRSRDDDRIFLGFNASDTQHGEPGNHPPTLLSRHMSLPKTSAEIASVEKYLHFQASVEKYLQFQDSVPCKIRAKRGCATHPRSIAERVRRTRISERMRKLQDLVPNMDKQTSTADMLNLAVEYIKALQKQVETLSDHRAKCTCNKRKT